MQDSKSMKKKLEQSRARQIGEGKNKRIIDKGRMINDGKNQERKMKTKKYGKK